MIYFNSRACEYYNLKVVEFLDAWYFCYDDGDDKSELLYILFPEHLIREQRSRCEEILVELDAWARDTYHHYLTPFHEKALYGLLEIVKEEISIDEEIENIFFKDESIESKKMLIEIWENDAHYENSAFSSLDEMLDYYCNIDTLLEHCFEDYDFQILPKMLSLNIDANRYSRDPEFIDADNYLELLPKDLQYTYKKTKDEIVHGIYNEVKAMLYHFNFRILKRGGYKVFWNDEKRLSEKECQIILENLFDAYIAKERKTELVREPDVGIGAVDFEFSRGINEKVIIELKLANSKRLEHGLTKQLIKYIQAINPIYSFYLIIAYDMISFKKAKELIEKYNQFCEENDIEIIVLDVRKMEVASRA